MDSFIIEGGHRLSGHATVDGSKNAVLPLLAAAILTDEPITLHGVPDLSDVSNMEKLLRKLGVAIEHPRPGSVTVRVVDEGPVHAPYEIVSTMRASICTLGPLLAKRGEARVAMPGGCAFGARPVDLHLRGLEALGAEITLDGGDIVCKASRLKGNTIFLGGPYGSTVLGTANIMSAAALAEGCTLIESAACEPEVKDLAALLNAMGAKIRGAGTPRIEIEGVERLEGAEHRVMPDRIVAATYAVAAAVTNGDITLEDFPYDSLLAAVEYLKEIGITVERIDPAEDTTRCTVRITSNRILKPSIITTQPFPGFPTDLQAQFLLLLCLAQGNSIITEKIYPERFMHVAELGRMGATLIRQGPTVMVVGGAELVGAQVMASDLRASACLVLAGLAARGESTVNRVYHLDRGYVRMERTLNALGASIERVSEPARVEAAVFSA
jgi:UDP-N-acetylglucosamine 1-carboxyvinyltransferase